MVKPSITTPTLVRALRALDRRWTRAADYVATRIQAELDRRAALALQGLGH